LFDFIIIEWNLYNLTWSGLLRNDTYEN